MDALLAHTFIYSWIWFCVGACYVLFHLDTYVSWNLTLAVLITFVSHTATDYVTSREVKKLFDKKDYHNGFVVIGIDQMAHYVQLFLCFKYLML